LLCGLGVGLETSAAAEPTVADQTFARGRELMRQKKFAEACAAFEQSQRLDPQFGTQFNLAGCDVELGKLATAWNLYRELARSDNKPARRQAASDLAAKLERRVPRIVVDVQPRPAGVKLTVDGEDSSSLIGVELHVDLGDHDVVAAAPGYRDVQRSVHVAREGQVESVSIALEAAGPTAAPTAPVDSAPGATVTGATEVHADAPAAPGAGRARAGEIAMIGGGALVAGGLVFGLIARSDYNSAASCTTCDKQEQSHHAVVLGDVATVLVIAGVVPVGAGLYLWKTAGSSAQVTAQVGDHPGVVVAGSF
jgi:hypothetical protein